MRRSEATILAEKEGRERERERKKERERERGGISYTTHRVIYVVIYPTITLPLTSTSSS